MNCYCYNVFSSLFLVLFFEWVVWLMVVCNVWSMFYSFVWVFLFNEFVWMMLWVVCLLMCLVKDFICLGYWWCDVGFVVSRGVFVVSLSWIVC